MPEDETDRPPLDPDRLAAPGWRVEVTEASPSTNADLAARARAGEPAGLVVVTEHQTAGRGRLDRVWVTCEGTVVADHARVWAWHQTITDFEHAVAAKLLRRGRADLLRPVPDPGSGDQVEVRPLGTYDAAFGLDGLDDELDGQVS